MGTHQHHHTTTIGVLSHKSLVDRILARLLGEAGYGTKLLDAHPTGHLDEPLLLLDGVDVLLLSSYLDPDVRRSFLEDMRRIPEVVRRIPVLSPSVPLQMTLQDELSVNVSWQSLFEGLVEEIETVRQTSLA